MNRRSLTILAAVLVAAAGCGKDEDEDKSCNPGDVNACEGGLVCEPVAGGEPGCFAPFVVAGKVTELGAATVTPIPGARVVALDSNRSPASAVVTTDASGNYTLTLPVTRAADGSPLAQQVTLRADAQGYQTFPAGIRPALPIDLASGALVSGSYRIAGGLADIGLIPLADSANLGIIRGTVGVPATRVGVLVVAEPVAGGAGTTAIADRDGKYVVFNLPATAGGTAYAVNAYARGVNFVEGTASLTPNGDPALAPVVDLAIANTTTATVSGSLIFNQVDPPTSVALVLKSTYVPTLDRGESPPGLVAVVLSGNDYTFPGVPDGEYIALAAFGIDGIVRNVAEGGNTAPVDVVVQNGALVGTLGQFKLLGAVNLTHIDGQAIGTTGAITSLTSATPVFTWESGPSYSAADLFEVVVYDAFGNAMGAPLSVPKASGTYNATYAGPALEHGMYYQLRIRALDDGTIPATQLSQTEDLKGVFYYP